MISSSLSIKILGCAFGVSMTIGIPLIVRDVKAAKAQAIIDDPDNVSKFLLNNDSSGISEGESFSNAAFKEDGVPKKEQEKNIAANGNTIIQKAPSNFFTPYLVSYSDSKSALTEPGVCYLHIGMSNIKNQPAGPGAKHLYVPVPKEKIKTTKKLRKEEIKLWIENKLAWKVLKNLDSEGDSNFERLKTMGVSDFESLKTTPNSQKYPNGKTNDRGDQNTAEDILFFEDIYKVTSKRLHELGYELPSGDFGEYKPDTCNPKISQ